MIEIDTSLRNNPLSFNKARKALRLILPSSHHTPLLGANFSTLPMD